MRPLPRVTLKRFTAQDVVCRWDVVEARHRATAAIATSFLEVILERMPFSYKLQPFMIEAFPEEWLRSLQRLQQLDVNAVVPGHGEVCDKGYLRERLVTVQGAIERG